MTKIARPSTHLPPSAREGSPQVPLWSRTKPQPPAEAPASLYLTSPGGRGTRASSAKEEPPAGRERSREGCVSLSLPAVPGGLRPAAPGGWMLALPPARRTLRAAPPCHLHLLSSALENQLWALGPSGTRGHSLRYSRGHASVRNGEPETEAPLGDTHVHRQVIGDTVTHTHTEVHTDALQAAQGHASQDTDTQVSQTHTPEPHTHCPEHRTADTHGDTRVLGETATPRNTQTPRGHGDICRPPVRWRHRNTHTHTLAHTHTWLLARDAPALSPGEQ